LLILPSVFQVTLKANMRSLGPGVNQKFIGLTIKNIYRNNAWVTVSCGGEE